MSDTTYHDISQISDIQEYDMDASLRDFENYLDTVYTDNNPLHRAPETFFASPDGGTLGDTTLDDTLLEVQSLSSSFIEDAKKFGSLQHSNPAYRAPNRVRDRLVDHSPTKANIEGGTWEELRMLNEHAPRPEDHVQNIYQYPVMPTIDMEREANSWTLVPDRPEPHPNILACTGGNERLSNLMADLTEAGPSIIKSPQNCSHDGDQPLLEDTVSQRTIPPTSNQAGTSQQIEIPCLKNRRFGCAECKFAKVAAKCDGSANSPCSRCLNLVAVALAELNPTKLLPDRVLTVPQVLFFDIDKTQTLLTELRREIDERTFQDHRTSLEDCFDSNSHILCHFDEGRDYSPYSSTSVTIAITRLATTRRTRLAHANPRDPIKPSLAADRLDVFTDARAPRKQIRDLKSKIDQSIITTAWRCAYYLGLLFNWNAHLIYYDRISPRGISLPLAKNLILEVMYAVAYRIQGLLSMLMFLVHETLAAKPKNENYDPVAIICALRIIYSSVEKFRQLSVDDGGILKLKEFLNGLHFRVPAALRAVQLYRYLKLGLCCRESDHLSFFQNVIKDCAIARSMVNFAFEHFRANDLLFLPGSSDRTQCQSYTDMLACPVPFLDDDGLLFTGSVSRMGKPTISNNVPDLYTTRNDTQKRRTRKRTSSSTNTSPRDQQPELTNGTTLDGSNNLTNIVEPIQPETRKWYKKAKSFFSRG